LVEEKKAKLVVIAHDVDPIETVLWLPQLCRKQDVPFCFIKGKARLGKIVNKKTATCVAITDIRKEHQADFDNLTKTFLNNYNNNTDLRKVWGGGGLGLKSTHQREAKEKAIETEQIKKSGLWEVFIFHHDVLSLCLITQFTLLHIWCLLRELKI